MKSSLALMGTLALGLLVGAPSAEAKGCIKGAVVGGVAGHYAGHHAVLGAMGGCVVGRRLAREKAARAADIGISVIIAANRIRHPMDARTMARLAAQYAGQGVTGFGLSNDERRGPAADFGPAFRIAERAGLMLVPHAGELAGPSSVTAALDVLHASRLGHGVRAAEDPRLVERIAAAQVACEVCPSSNVSLGVAPDEQSVPVRRLFEAGVPLALGADDPLLFGPGLLEEYELCRRELGLDDEQRTTAGAEGDGAIGTAQLLQADDFAVIGSKIIGITRLQSDAGNAHRGGGGKWQFAHQCLRCGNA